MSAMECALRVAAQTAAAVRAAGFEIYLDLGSPHWHGPGSPPGPGHVRDPLAAADAPGRLRPTWQSGR
jgi:hypothetical protein